MSISVNILYTLVGSQTFCEGRCRQLVAPEDNASCVGVCSGSALGCSTRIPGLMNDPSNKLLEQLLFLMGWSLVGLYKK